MHLNVFVCTLFAGSKPVKTQTRSNRTGTDPTKNQTDIGLVPRWQKPDRTEPFRGVKRAIVSFEKIVDLSSSFSKNHSRESFKNSISSQSFAISRLILFVSFSFLTRISTNIANQIVNARDSSSLISISSDFENSANVDLFSKFDFTSRSYESSVKASDSTFSVSKKNSKVSSFESTRANSILDSVENSRSSSIAQATTRNTVNCERSIFILQFILHSRFASQIQSAKSAILNSKLIFSEQFSSKSTTSDFDKQTARTTVKYEISRNISAIETIFSSNMTQEFNETQRRELMTMMQKF